MSEREADHPPGAQMTALGPPPNGWRVVRLGEVVEFEAPPFGLGIAGL